MAHSKFKCACGTTTRRTEGDAMKFVAKKKGKQTTPNYKPTGKKSR